MFTRYILTYAFIYDILLPTKWRNLSDAAWCALTEAQSAGTLMHGIAFAEPSYWDIAPLFPSFSAARSWEVFCGENKKGEKL